MSKYPITRYPERDFESIRSGLLGARIGDVYYQQTPFGGLTGEPAGAVHEVDLGVVLELSTGAVVVTWERDSLIEGLAVPPIPSSATSDGIAIVRVGKLDGWREFIDQIILEVEPVWQVSERGCPESLWSIRLGIEGGGRVTVALGQLDRNDHPTYHPDGLLVIFDRRIAESYRHAGSPMSAWGS